MSIQGAVWFWRGRREWDLSVWEATIRSIRTCFTGKSGRFKPGPKWFAELRAAPTEEGKP